MKTLLLTGLLLAAIARPVAVRGEEKFEVDAKVVEAARTAIAGLKAETPARPRRLLLFGVSGGPHRNVIPSGKAVIQLLGESTGACTVTVAEDRSIFAKSEELKAFDAVCFCNTTGEVFRDPIDYRDYKVLPPDEKRKRDEASAPLVANLVAYVNAGGGFFGIHAATDCLKQHKAYGEMIGAYFDGHPWSSEQTVTVRVEDAGSALLRDVFGASAFRIQDEIYQFRDPYSREKLRVLLSLDLEHSDKAKGGYELKRADNDYPVAWVRRHGQGRVFYSSLGHNAAIYANPEILKLWLRGLQFVLGDLEAETAPRFKP